MSNSKPRYSFIKQIGSGSFGKVYKSLDNTTNTFVAIKKINRVKLRKNDYLQKAFWKELDIMKSINSKYSVKFIELIESMNNHNIVMELCDDDLENELQRHSKGFSIQQIKTILSQLNEVFYIMYQRRIMHRDLKLKNIFIKYTGPDKLEFIPKLGDFGFGKIVSNDITSTKLGTPLTMAPEVLRGLPYSSKADLWSIGVIIYQLYSKVFPFLAFNEKQILEKIYKMELKQLPKDQLLSDLIRRLLTIDPNKRMSWEEYFNHKFFEGNKLTNNNENILHKEINNNNHVRESLFGKEKINGAEYNVNNKFKKSVPIRTEYKLKKEIKFGFESPHLQIFFSINNADNKYYIIKQYSIEIYQKNITQFFKDIYLSKALSSSICTLKCIDYFQTKENVNVIYEYIENVVPLSTYVKENKITEEQLKKATIELIDKLFIPTENTNSSLDIITEYSFLFIPNSNRFILCDFGFLKYILKEESSSYTTLNEQNHINTQTNVLNFGISLYNIFFNTKLNFQSITKSIPLSDECSYSKDYLSFLSTAMTKNSKNRPTWKILRQHSFINEKTALTKKILFNKEILSNIIEGLQSKYILLVSSLLSISKDHLNQIICKEFIMFLQLTKIEMLLASKTIEKIKNYSPKTQFNVDEELCLFKIIPGLQYPYNFNAININFEQISLGNRYIIFCSEMKKELDNFFDTIKIIHKQLEVFIKKYNKKVRYVTPKNAKEFIEDLVKAFRSSTLVGIVKKLCEFGFEQSAQIKNYYEVAKSIEEFIIAIRNLAINKVEQVTDGETITQFFMQENEMQIIVSIDQLNKKQEEYIFVSFLSSMFKMYFKQKGMFDHTEEDENYNENEQEVNKYGITKSVVQICSSNMNDIIEHYLTLISLVIEFGK